MNDTINYVRKINKKFFYLNDKDIENTTIDLLLSTPYKRVADDQAYKIVNAGYFPGLFYIIERKSSPEFLFDENSLPYDNWLEQKILSEIIQVGKDVMLGNRIAELGGNEVVLGLCINILHFKNKNNMPLESLIINQEYSDFFRRIVMFVLTGNPFFIYNNHASFNSIGINTIPYILEQTKNYTLREKLFLSIASGLIGMDIKDGLIHTSPISLNSSMKLDSNNLNKLVDELDIYIHSSEKIGIDCFEEFITDIIKANRMIITWFTDDYIETMFELKFIEELLSLYEHITINIVPRYASYSNDASFFDVLDMLQLPLFSRLRDYYNHERLLICRNGMDISTVDFFRMSVDLFNIMSKTDLCVISGARAYEMTQGLNLKTYYTGIAVCKSYTESITGFSKKNGALIFLSQDKGDYSFSGFKERSHRRLSDGNDIIPVAGFTTREYYCAKIKRQKY